MSQITRTPLTFGKRDRLNILLGVVLAAVVMCAIYLINPLQTAVQDLPKDVAVESAIATQYPNWQPYSNLGVPGLNRQEINAYPNWQPYPNLGIPGLNVSPAINEETCEQPYPHSGASCLEMNGNGNESTS